ncbi:hypothetical protein VFPPC_06320 [Pochonia chlamydosporia 170]|uniref:Uncharacterized protein n=1 Tax=Pochonia chlamydosporia 170 TaxID=1380566 RepID=A0A179FJG3_METCM|nr:hypothetical protein VFPPC_06320 [Pochonia chlamydosporia 170]OAQ65163.1 hypothetical protein VFPPC_06320 [Pochonia chlamydosporia 170]
MAGLSCGHLFNTGYATKRCRARYIRHLKDRRERLKQLALTNLTFFESTSLGLHSSIVLDSRASEVVRILRDRGVKIPQALAIGSRSLPIFLDHRFSLQTAEFLFNLGFRDIDPFTNFTEGLTQIWSRWWAVSPEQVESLHWLSKHGLDLSRPLFPSSRSPQTQLRRGVCVAHIAFYDIGLKEFFFDFEVGEFKSIPLRWLASLLDSVLPVGLADNCRCRCCPGGCTPLIYLFKGIENPHWPSYASKHKYSSFLYHISVTEMATCWRVEDHIAAMRYMTFDAFEIRHTCCNPILLPQEGHCTDDLDSIEEDDASLNVFENLILEFEEELQKRAASTSSEPTVFVDFWETLWPARIAEENEKLAGSNISDSERRNAEELGVIWDDPVKLGCEPTPAPDKNPYETHQIEHWYYELEKISPA